jgi:CubicO group peptidase (beta-lactamase class C family)
MAGINMRLTIKRIAKTLGILLLVLLIGGGSWVTKPWDDLQSWRWYTMPFESLRAEVFSNWEVIQPVAPLQASTNPRQYQRNVASPESVSYPMGNERIPLTAYLEKANISGLMVLQDGEVKLEYYAKGLSRESRNHIWSATKSFTSTLVAMAHFEGRIESRDDRVARYAPQFAGTAYGESSIRHVLMMSSGIDFFHFKGTPDRNNMYGDIMQERQDFDAWAGALGRHVPPGSDFNYIATDTHVLSAVLRGAYGQSFTEIVQDRLWQRGGFGGDATWGLDGSCHPMGHCCLTLRLEEFTHLGQLYVENLVLDGQQTVHNDWFSMVENPQAPFQEPRLDEAGDLQRGYSVQFWIPHDYDQEFIAAGAFDQYLWIDRRQGTVVAQFSTGQQMLFTQRESGAGPEEFPAVMRTLASRETFH